MFLFRELMWIKIDTIPHAGTSWLKRAVSLSKYQQQKNLIKNIIWIKQTI